MSSVEASGERGIAVGRDAIQSILVTGNANQFFFGEYQRLADAYIHPWSVFDRVNLKRFTGRGWLESRVDDFLTQNDRGLFILEAGAGLGKTAFLAHLARERGYVHHFVELRRGLDGVAPGLMSLAAQLVRAWVLKPYITQATLPASAARPEFFQNLLKAAADQRDQTKPGEKIVLVVDALDEAGTPANQNVLGLPRALPAGVYLIVSQRPVEVTLVVEGPRHVEPLKAEDENNLADMRAFLEKALTWPGIQKALGEGRISDSQFVETLLEKSRGVWIYLHYVVAEIEASRYSPLKLDELPRDLWQYYADYWDRWREAHSQTWDSVDLPLLITLAAAQDSLTLDTLLALAGIDRKPDVSERIGEVLDFKWVPYLAVSTAGSYRFHHASLRDFFNGAIDQRNLSETQRKRVQRFAKATKEAHARIADFYIQRWGGWDARLSTLQKINPARDDTLDLYGLRHLAAHLEAAGREDELHRLMRLEWSVPPGEQTSARFENSWYTVHERVGDASGYLSDMGRAWQLAEKAYAGRQSSSAIGLQCRYALIVTSLRSLAGNIPPALLAALVEKGIWPGPQGLAYARQIQEPKLRIRALAALVPRLGLTERDQALREALTAARAIGDEESRSAALAALAPRLAPTERDQALREALEAARAIGDEEYRSAALVALAPHLTAPLLGEALEAARAIGEERLRSQALVALAPRLAPTERDQALREALEAARAIKYEGSRSEALAALAPHLTAPLLGEALEAARAIGDEEYRSNALAALAPRLAPTERDQALRKARTAARAIVKEGEHYRYMFETLAKRAPFRSAALVALAPRLAAPTERDQALCEALTAVRAIVGERLRSDALAALAPRLAELGHPAEDEYYRSAALAALAPRLAELGHPAEALTAARAIGEEYYRSAALVALAPRLAPTERDQALREALTAVQAIGEEDEWSRYMPETLAAREKEEWSRYRCEMLAALAPHLTAPLLGEALEAARAIEDGSRSGMLAALAPQLADLTPATLSPLWSRTLRHLATRTRWNLLRDLSALVPLLTATALGGAEATAETFRAIQDVGRWWP